MARSKRLVERVTSSYRTWGMTLADSVSTASSSLRLSGLHCRTKSGSKQLPYREKVNCVCKNNIGLYFQVYGSLQNGLSDLHGIIFWPTRV